MTDFLNLLRCPLCGTSFRRETGSLVCEAGHRYDVSRAGYVNLLPPGKARNARTGDEQAMVKARSAFLRRGFYDPIDDALADALAEMPADAVGDGDRLSVADLGCGEGTHTCRVAALLREKTGRAVEALGFDASKTAAESGCRLARERGYFTRDGVGCPTEGPVVVACLPANLFRLPLADGSVDIALSLFAPIAGEQTRRILGPGGVFAVVSSGREHLIELRRAIYDEVRLSDEGAPQVEGFTKIGSRTVRFPVELGRREDIENLFVMTPFYYKTTEEGRERLLSRDRMTVTAEAQISLFVR